MAKKLNRATVSTEEYPIKVLQYGDGNFLRGFADWIIDILNEEAAFSGSVVTVAPLRRDSPPTADDQDGLFHVVLRGISEGKPVDSVRLISCMTLHVNPYLQFDDYLDVGVIPSLSMVISNTTEAGISFNERDRLNAPADSFPGKVTQLLYRRFRTFQGDPSGGLIFLPCELVENNGDMLKKLVLQYAQHWNLPEQFITWVSRACMFCNTLVDRIVTGYPNGYAHEIKERTGFDDSRLVAAEPYHLWVIEAEGSLKDILPVHRTSLNVKFTNDLSPYRISKVRILNGAHTAMTLVGYLRGLRTVREAVEDPWMADFLQRLVTEEIAPTIPLPAEDVLHYVRQVFERFHNAEIRHELKSIALNSVSKFRTRLLPTLLDHHRSTGQLPHHLIFAFAALIVFYRGSWRGEPLPVNDNPDALAAMAGCWSAGDTPKLKTLLANVTLWGSDLTTISGLEASLEKDVVRLG